MGIDLVNLRKPNSKLILGKDESQLDLYHTMLKSLEISGIRDGVWHQRWGLASGMGFERRREARAKLK